MKLLHSVKYLVDNGKRIYRNISGQRCQTLCSMIFSQQLLKLNQSGRKTRFFFQISKEKIYWFSGFNTTVDVKLQQWTEKELPRQCVRIGHLVLLDEFQALIEREQNSRSYDPIANDLKLQVVQECRSRHQWDAKAVDLLVKFDVCFNNSSKLLPFVFSIRKSFKLKHYKIEMFPINNNGKRLRNSWKTFFDKNSSKKNQLYRQIKIRIHGRDISVWVAQHSKKNIDKLVSKNYTEFFSPDNN